MENIQYSEGVIAPATTLTSTTAAASSSTALPSTPIPPVELSTKTKSNLADSLTDTFTATVTVAKHTSILVLGQIVVQASMAVIGILVARLLGRDLYGQYALAFSMVGMFGLLFSLGADAIIVREIARLRIPNAAWFTLSGGLWLRLISFPITLSIIMGAAFINGYDATQRLYIFLTALLFGTLSFTDLTRAVFQAQQRMLLDTLSRSVEKIGGLVLVGVVVLTMPNLTGVFIALIAGALLSLGMSSTILVRLIGKPQIKPPREAWRLLKIAAPVGGSMFIISLYLQLPTVILSRFAPVGDVGLYNAANSLIAPFSLLPVAVGTALLPMLANSLDMKGSSMLVKHLLLVVVAFCAGLPIVVGAGGLGDEVLHLLYGDQFIDAANALATLGFMIPLVFVNTYLGNFLIASDQQRYLLLVTIATLCLTGSLSYVLTASMGYEGTALARVLAEAGNMTIMLLLTLRYIHRQPKNS